MRILHLLKHCDRGNGHVHVAVDLACEQASRGHDVVFASGGGTYVELLEHRGVRHALVQQTMKRSAVGMARLLGLVWHKEDTVVHAHMMGAAAMGYAITRLFGGALVTTVHNSFDSHSGLMRLGDRVVAVSRAERELLLARGYSAAKLDMVHNGPLGSARESLFPDGTLDVPQPYIMTLSGLHARKRVDDAISAFAALSGAFPEWRLVVVGEGPDEAGLRSHAVALGISDRVVFAGRTLNPARLLGRASIFACLSEAEPFGLVAAEARAAGCAVVVSDAGGLPEVVEDGRAGLVVPARDVAAATRAMAGLMGDPKELDRWRAAALEGVGRFSVTGMADGYERVYGDAVQARKSAERMRTMRIITH